MTGAIGELIPYFIPSDNFVQYMNGIVNICLYFTLAEQLYVPRERRHYLPWHEDRNEFPTNYFFRQLTTPTEL